MYAGPFELGSYIRDSNDDSIVVIPLVIVAIIIAIHSSAVSGG